VSILRLAIRFVKTKQFESDPEGAIASLHRTVTAGEADPDALFALAEMSHTMTGAVAPGLRCLPSKEESATTSRRQCPKGTQLIANPRATFRF
jgi:hypothetical protein